MVIRVWTKTTPKNVASPICIYLAFTDLSGYTKCELVPQGDTSLLSRTCGSPLAPQSPEGCSWASLPTPPPGPSDPASFNKPFNMNYKRCLSCLRRREDKSKLLEVGESVCLFLLFWVCFEKENFQICRGFGFVFLALAERISFFLLWYWNFPQFVSDL